MTEIPTQKVWLQSLCSSLLLSLSCFMSTMQIKYEYKTTIWDFLVVQWLRIRLPMQGTQVRSLVREDPTCHEATKPVCYSYWAWALEATNHNYWAHTPQLLKPRHLTPCSATREATAMRSPCTTTKSSPHSPQLEKACMQQRRPNTARNK